jgi:hypothetical protein
MISAIGAIFRIPMAMLRETSRADKHSLKESGAIMIFIIYGLAPVYFFYRYKGTIYGILQSKK